MRLLIVSVIILIIAIPPLLGAPPFYLQGPPSPNAERWLDFLRTFAATLSGAGIAFLANRYLQDRARRLEEVAAGNFAMIVLMQQYHGFKNVQRAVKEEVGRRDELAPNTPLWFTFRPVLHHVPREILFDFESLTFLFEDRATEVFEKLFMVQVLYRDLLGYVERLNADSIEKQQRLEDAKVGQEGGLDARRAEAIVGPRLRFELEALR